MRIIGGEAGGRIIPSPKGSGVRPTPDMIREALFNVLEPVGGTVFLDLFAGTGSVGIEALSRGAQKVVFVEKNKHMAIQIKSHIQALNYKDRADVMAFDASRGISMLSKAKNTFDIVFADPPYEKDLVSKTMQHCLDNGLIADEGLMVLQHSIREPVFMEYFGDSVHLIQERRYGDTLISFLNIQNKEH
jgi:16S rRNA (guanine966-N2)-methyltransferase